MFDGLCDWENGPPFFPVCPLPEGVNGMTLIFLLLNGLSERRYTKQENCGSRKKNPVPKWQSVQCSYSTI